MGRSEFIGSLDDIDDMAPSFLVFEEFACRLMISQDVKL
jgi:hypothetical protein